MRTGCGGSYPGALAWQAKDDALTRTTSWVEWPNAKEQLCREDVLNVLELAEAVAHALCSNRRQGGVAAAAGADGASRPVERCELASCAHALRDKSVLPTLLRDFFRMSDYTPTCVMGGRA